MIVYPNIAFIGRAGSGKSTAAGMLAAHWGYERRSFAKPLKDLAVTLWGTEALRDRGRLQRLGRAVREIDPEAWIRPVVRGLSPQGPPVVVDDCRFPNEAVELLAHDFVLVRVTAPEHVRRERLIANGKWAGPEVLEDASETALDGYKADYVLDNSRHELQDLLDQLTDLIRKEVDAA